MGCGIKMWGTPQYIGSRGVFIVPMELVGFDPNLSEESDPNEVKLHCRAMALTILIAS